MNIKAMEKECKNSLGYMKMSAKYCKETQELVETFLEDAATRIINMQRIFRGIMKQYEKLTLWLGVSQGMTDLPPKKLAGILLQFSTELRETSIALEADQRKANTRTSKLKMPGVGGKSNTRTNKLKMP